jgi:N-acetylneuraminic acid mutarotase
MFINEPPTPMTRTVRALVLSLVASVTPARSAWEPLPPLPEPNGGFVCGTINGGIVVAGGTKWLEGKKLWLDKIWWFEPRARQWIAKGVLPHPLAYAVCGPWRDGVIIAGGFDGGRARDEVWQLDQGFHLNPVGHLKSATSVALGGICNDELVVIGGSIDPARLDALSAQAQGMRLPGGAPKDVAAPDRTPRGTGASATIAGRLWIFGGTTPDPVNQIVNLSDAWSFDTGNGRWQSLPPYPIRARGISCAPLDRRHLYLAGGYGDEADDFTDKAFIYDVETGAYSGSVPLPIANFTSLIVCGDHIYALGGEPEKKMRTDKCWRIRMEELGAGK